MTTPPSAVPALRRWWGLPAGALLLAALITYALATVPAEPAVGAVSESVTYEISGPSAAVGIQYGDIYSQAYSPFVATRLPRTMLPWRVTVPLRGPISSHDLDARSDPPGAPVTCTVRRGDAVVVTRTARGLVGCDTTPG